MTKGLAEDKREGKVETRSSSSSLDWKSDCFICSCKIVEFGEEWHSVHSCTVRDTILRSCETRLQFNAAEDWAVSVKARITNCSDLIAFEARYHQNCRVQFSALKFTNTTKPVGRPKDIDKITAFELTCNWLEYESSIQTVSRFAEKMKELSNAQEPYVNRHIKHLLTKKYHSNVIIKNMGAGKEDLITFEDTAKNIMEEHFKANNERQNKDTNNNGNIIDDKEKMIDLVGHLIKEEIGKVSQSSMYPSPQELNDIDNLNSWIPDSLKRLLEIIIPGDLKRMAIEHTIISASRRNFNSPLLFGLGVQLDHSFGSKWLNTHLSRLGFSVTYSQVRNYKKAVMESFMGWA